MTENAFSKQGSLRGAARAIVVSLETRRVGYARRRKFGHSNLHSDLPAGFHSSAFISDFGKTVNLGVQLADILLCYVKQSRLDCIGQRDRMESIVEMFAWKNLRSYYDTAHDLAIKRKKP